MKKTKVIIDKILYTLMVFLFIAMLGITTLNVIFRFFFSLPIPCAVELGRYCFVGIIYLGGIYVMRENGHIGLDIFVNMLPDKIKKIIQFTGNVLVIIFLLIFSYEACRMVAGSVTVKSSSLKIPMSIPYSAMVIGGIGMCIEAFFNLIFSHEDRDNREPKL